MISYTYTAHLHTARFSPDWSTVDETYSTPQVVLQALSDRARYSEWGGLDGTGMYLDTPNGLVQLEFEPLMVQRLEWDGGWTDVLWIDAHVRDGEGSVLGFDTYYIELAGTALPDFASVEDFSAFLAAAEQSTPTKGLFKDGRAFRWAEAMALDQIDGTPNREKILGDLRDDLIFGHDGRDRLYGDEGNDTLYGGRHNDLLDGGVGNDELRGDGGHDTLMGGDGNDRLFGGRGNDVLDGGAGDDRMSGGIWADTFVFGTGYGSDRILDFNVAEGDRIQLSSSLWDGTKSAFDVVMEYGNFAQPGRILLTFDGGERLYIYENVADGLVGLHGAIDIL